MALATPQPPKASICYVSSEFIAPREPLSLDDPALGTTSTGTNGHRPRPYLDLLDPFCSSVSHELPNFLINASAPARQEKSLMTASSFKSRIRRTGMAIGYPLFFLPYNHFHNFPTSSFQPKRSHLTQPSESPLISG